MRNDLIPYGKYKKIDLLWLNSIPCLWKVVKNNSLWAERKIVNCLNEDLLSVTIKKGIIRQTDLLRNTSKRDSSNLDKSKYKLLMPEDIAYNKMRMWQGAVGKSKYRGIVSPAYVVLRPIAEMNTDYYHYLFRTPHYIEESHRYSYGICDDQLNLRYEDFKSMQIVFPPIDEQDQIVRYLDSSIAKINKFIKIKKKLIEVLKEQKQAIINEAVTRGIDPNAKMKPSGIDWMGDIPEEWEVMRLRYIGNCQNGISESSEYFGSGFPFVSYGDVYNNSYLPNLVSGLANSTEKQQETYSVTEGDIFFTRTSETIAEVGLTSVCTRSIDKAIFSGFLIRFRPMKGIINKYYSKFYFRNSKVRTYFTREMNLVTRASLSQGLLKNLPVLLPSSIYEQEQIADFIEKSTKLIENSILSTQKEINLITEYRTRLISDVVTGRVNVRGIVVDDVIEDLVGTFDEELLDDESLSDEDGDENAN